MGREQAGRTFRDEPRADPFEKSLRVSEEIARQIFAPYLEPDKNVLPRRGELGLKAFDQVLQLMGEAGVVATPVPAAERFIDLRYLQAAGIQ